MFVQYTVYTSKKMFPEINFVSIDARIRDFTGMYSGPGRSRE